MPIRGNEYRVCITYCQSLCCVWWLYPLLFQGIPIKALKVWLLPDDINMAMGPQSLGWIFLQQLQITNN
jgi:hypothetical protein